MSINELEERTIVCPSCGETITMLLDGSVSPQNYIEDCQVCCRPIVVVLNMAPDGELSVIVSNENE